MGPQTKVHCIIISYGQVKDPLRSDKRLDFVGVLGKTV